MSKKEHLCGFIGIFVVVFGVYLWTVAPTLSFWDCGEYIACAYSLGVPHPPGGPFHVLLRKIFTLIPFGKEIGFRANMLSVVTGAFSAAFIWLIIVKIIERTKKIETRWDKILATLGGIVGALIAAFSYTCWWNSVESEAYGLATCILILCLWLTFKWEENLNTKEYKKYLLLIGYLIALSSGIHLTPLLAVPGILLFIFMRNREKLRDPGILRFIALILPFFALCASAPLPIILLSGGFAIGFIIWPSKGIQRDVKFFALTALLLTVGFTTYSYLIIRARQNPRINETAPTNLEKLWASFTRQQYGPSGFKIIFQRKTASKENKYNFFQALGFQYKFFGDYLCWQWAPYPREERWEKRTLSNFIKISSVGVNVVFILLHIFGLWWHFKKGRNTFFLVGVTFLVTTILFVFYMNFKFSPSDPNPLHRPTEVRERHYFFGPAFALFGLHIGLGFYALISMIKQKLQIIGLPLGLVAFIPLVSNYWSHANRRGLWVADDYGCNMLLTCEDGATLFTNGDNDTFPLWFAQEVKKVKPSVNVANLSLLNTSWHIKQLKQMGVPISFTDYEIENLESMPWPILRDGKYDRSELLLTKDFAVRDIIATSEGHKFKKKVFMPIKRKLLPKQYRKKFPKEMTLIPPSYYVRRVPEKYWMRIPEEYLLPHQEFADLILKDGYTPKKPVYFAVTVSESNLKGFRPYLRMEGLANRVVGPKEARFDIERSDSLLNKVYKYRSIFDPNVYMDQNTKRLLTNYAAAYFYLGTAYRARGELRKAIEAFEFGRAFRGDQVLPFIHQLVSLYEEIGEKEKAMEYLRQTSVELNQEAIWYRLGISHLRENDIEEAESCFYKAIYANPEDPAYGYAGLIETYYTQQDTKKVREIFKLCANNPKMTGKILGIFKANQKDELAESLLKTWLTYHPYDTVARDLLKEM